MRLFLGFEIPEIVSERLAPICRSAPGVREVSADNLHLTVKFMGEIAPRDAEEVDTIVRSLTLPKVVLGVDGLGFFKQGGRNISVIWAGVTATSHLKSIRNRLDTALLDVDIDREPRRFTPHITLGRVKSAPQAAVQQLIADHGGVRISPVELDRLCLFESHLGRHGADYQVIADYPLAPAGHEPS